MINALPSAVTHLFEYVMSKSTQARRSFVKRQENYSIQVGSIEV